METETQSIFAVIKKRLSWLILGLVTSVLLSKFISVFEETLEKNIIMITFVPMIVYLADAIGTQMESIIIRDFAKQKKFRLLPFLIRQTQIVSVIGLVLSLLAYGTSYVLYQQHKVSMGLGISIFISSFTALISGSIIPYFFWKLHEDPAEASGPIATVVQDSLSIMIYFAVFSLLVI
ncbi:hypothetical protein A3K34_01960 [candidate division WWE3 bacterium RIFOXYC1_FULL_40_10]|uniref:SLC41A/MgtE integral membrane domain-containing protein n=1 Tax=candidate division WWE3 bacterium RIFOXYA2_FULL_46_9 TaxID=1802636 RepID=A0A1F4VZQ9_UNCKA|nr:MAG: hypothetical protein A3K58_01960 [candidate division WWE3 bacterium RIFOXYB1_FULL_40_22]OGC61626.1 MAG: hypothetical protein A3K37_01960 [candidate division WWE3 bacterium RIFOXYA1_FULL_40_11]OGC62669.1 MAG: hypothetical protein A2264_02255 [candidate division WWE3 bacterium RIFOXYA2_FULL_46_9]OGC64697.1 MAG: hypothetical protein A2326_01485 [candidate division WWE3 bacterium RIFOXYB2_FULL_41_6]OGC66009.1 MAG: hypothetical protein A3K34_01960 [candidate division WWE3 bacterium RIFOXYC1_